MTNSVESIIREKLKVALANEKMRVASALMSESIGEFTVHAPQGTVTRHTNLSDAVKNASHGSKLFSDYGNGIRQHVGTMNGKRLESATE
jgi:hypothetical protein